MSFWRFIGDPLEIADPQDFANLRILSRQRLAIDQERTWRVCAKNRRGLSRWAENEPFSRRQSGKDHPITLWVTGFPVFPCSVSEEDEFLGHPVEGAAGFRQCFGKRAKQMARRVGRCIGIIGRSTEGLAGE